MEIVCKNQNEDKPCWVCGYYKSLRAAKTLSKYILMHLKKINRAKEISVHIQTRNLR